MLNPSPEDIELFKKLIDENRFDFCKLVYLIFPFGEPDHPLEHYAPYDWQMEEWKKLSDHLSNPETRYNLYRLIISSGNGAAKTAFGAMTLLMLMYTQQLRSRITANTDPQMKTVVWPEYTIWYQHARFHEHFFEKFGTSIKAKNEALADTWRIDTITWAEESPAAISGLHNKGKAVAYCFEEAPGIPSVIWKYAMGAFTETETIKIFMAFGNSDDPESQFEQNMESPLWNARRIDTRELKHIDKNFISDLLVDCGGDEDHDDFRVRVRGLPRKTSKDSIISKENVIAAINRAKGFDKRQVEILPCILMCDPAWTGGDETCIAYSQGQYTKLLEKFTLDKLAGDTHQKTYERMCYWEKQLGADLVVIDQAEGTTLYTLAVNAGKTNWTLVSFAQNPTDNVDPKMSEYANLRAQMYYEYNKWLARGGVLDSEKKEWLDDIQKQLTWAHGTRHKITGKKLVESKKEIKERVGRSPDVADSLVMRGAYEVLERLPENEIGGSRRDRFQIGEEAFKMPDPPMPDYDNQGADGLYD